MKKTARLAAASAPLCLALTGALAQDVPPVDTITVKGTMREQTLLDVPVAVTVVTGEYIEKAQINDILDLEQVVPSLRVVQTYASAVTVFAIRGFGFGAIAPGFEPSVGVYIDDVYRSKSAAALADFPNIKRVEVVKGPQPTLFPKNASVGAVSIYTEVPQFEMDGFVDLTYGNYNQRTARGYITGPLTDDLAFSFGGAVNRREGYAENLTLNEDLNNRDRFTSEVQFLYEPNERVSIRALADYGIIDETCCYLPYVEVGDITEEYVETFGANINAEPFEYFTFLDLPNTNEIDNWGGSLQGLFDLGPAKLETITAYRGSDLFQSGDVDFSDAPVVGEFKTKQSVRTFTQEFGLFGETDRFTWNLGAFYLKEEIDQFGNILVGDAFDDFVSILVADVASDTDIGERFGNFFPNGIQLSDVERFLSLNTERDELVGTFFQTGGPVPLSLTEQQNDAVSLSARTELKITEKLIATLGVAYNYDRKKVFVGGEVNEPLFSTDIPGRLQERFLAEILGFEFLGGFIEGFDPELRAAFAEEDPEAFAEAQARAEEFALTRCASGVPLGEPGNRPRIDCNVLASVLEFERAQFIGPVVELPNAVEDGVKEDDAFTYTATLGYDIQPTMNVYFSYATGFKPASANLTAASAYPVELRGELIEAGVISATERTQPGTRFVDPERSSVYEIGFKWGIGEGYLNMALFDQRVEDFQQLVYTGDGILLRNAGEQRTRGFEIDSLFSPFPESGLGFLFSGTFLDPEYVEFDIGSVVRGSERDLADGEEDGLGSLTGERPSGISDVYTFLGAQYEREFGTGHKGFMQVGWQYESEVPIADNVPEEVAVRKVSSISASAGFTFENGFEVRAWGRNINNDENFQLAAPALLQEESYYAFPSAPRTYGVTLKKSF